MALDDESRAAFWKWLEVHRKQDVDVQRFFETVTFKGAAGTAFFEDTRGFHKATVPVAKPRLAFELVWTLIPQFNTELKNPISIPRAAPEPWLLWVNRLAYKYYGNEPQ